MLRERGGIKVLGMLGGAAKGSYERLTGDEVQVCMYFRSILPVITVFLLFWCCIVCLRKGASLLMDYIKRWVFVCNGICKAYHVLFYLPALRKS